MTDPVAPPTDPAPPTTFSEMMALEAHGPDNYVGVGPRYPWGGLYGGQIASQALRAAGLTVEAAYRPHSLHAFFIRPGDHTEPIRFEVDRIRNGRSFTTRRVVARQSNGAIFNMAASFQTAEDAPDVAPIALDPIVARPEVWEEDSWSHVFERRQVRDRAADAAGIARSWFRMTEAIGTDPLIQACALTYISDDLPTEAVVRHHPDSAGVAPGETFDMLFMSASLDHSIWFHRPVDVGAWHVQEMRGRGVHGGRGLSIGDVFAADGTHAATISQEVLLRRRR